MTFTKYVGVCSGHDTDGLRSLQSNCPPELSQLMEVTVQVYISKKDQQWGPFDLGQLERLKEEGALKASDWAWEQGESAWVPLGEILQRQGKRLPVWRPAAAQRRTWNFYAPVAVGVVCVLLLIVVGWPTVVDADRLEYRDGVAYELNSDKPFEGKAVHRYPDGKARVESHYKAGQQHGWVRDFYPDGELQSEGRKEKGRFHGKVFYYHQNGEIKRQMNFVHGNLVEQDEISAKYGNTP